MGYSHASSFAWARAWIIKIYMEMGNKFKPSVQLTHSNSGDLNQDAVFIHLNEKFHLRLCVAQCHP